MARIVVAGAVNRDEVVRIAGPLVPGGAAHRLSNDVRLGGGGANAAVALALAGHSVALAAVVGDDAAGADLVAAVAARGVDVRAVRRAEGPTTRMLIVVDPRGERSIVRVGPYRAAELTAADVAAAGEPVDGLFVKAFSPGLVAALGTLAGRVPVVSEFPPPDFGHAWPVHTLVGSRAGLPPEALVDPFAWGRRWAGPGLRLAVVTDGAAGAEAHDGAGMRAVAAVSVRQVDATGAGDAFAAGLLHGLVQGRDLDGVLAVAARWGAIAAASEGSVLPPSAGPALRVM